MNEVGVGHNAPPTMVEVINETIKNISDWMGEHPVIQSQEDAKEAKTFLDRGKLGLKDLDDERDRKVRPLNEEVKKINDSYRPATTTISKVIDTLSDRLSDFIKQERQAREEANRIAAGLAREAELKAREAERLEREAIESANHGELGVDVAAHIADADAAFRDFERAQRAAAIAEKETHVKIGGGFTRAVSLKTKETLKVIDAVAAIIQMGVSPDIEEVVAKSARAYRKIYGELPNGVESQITEKV